MKKVFLFSILFSYAHASSSQNKADTYTQDTLSLTLPEAEGIFLNKNLDLIAQQFSIDSARAAIITSRLYDNPDLSYTHSFYNPEKKNFFGPEMSVEISQLIRLAGKRKKEIQLAEAAIPLQEFQFSDLVRTLRYVLRNDFYHLHFMEKSALLYETEISSLQATAAAFEEQESKGFAAPKEVLRIRSQLYTLQAEYESLRSQIEDVQSELKILLYLPSLSFIRPVANVPDMTTEAALQQIPLQSLIDTALASRADLKALEATVSYSRYDLALQKAMAKPDLTVSAGYDRLGGYVRNYNALGVSIPLPLFNRNQGNIKNAKIQVEVNKVQQESLSEKIRQEVTTGYLTALRTRKLLEGMDPAFAEKQQQLIEAVTVNFRKKNITLLEFLDFYEAYKQNVLQLNQLRFTGISALEQLNYSIGRPIFNQ